MAQHFLEFLTRHLELVIVFAMVAYGIYRIDKHNRHQEYAKKLLQKAQDKKLDEPTSLHPEIDDSKCTGCAACTSVCPEGDILKLINHKAVLVGPTKCVGHGECERACPMSAIKLVFGTKTRGLDIPRLTTHYETNVSGLYIAGELGGMGLIRNAIRQGASAADHALKNLKPRRETDFDIFIVGAGPAGLASALACIAFNKRYMIIDQNTFGGTVANFPRQKIVMSHPFKLPIIGEKKFQSNKVSKEELLAYWTEIRKKANIEINERVTFNNLEVIPTGFKISTSQGDYTAAKVILAMGVRGSPRRLGLENEDLPKVTYNLLEPEQYKGKEVCVVGGGNAGVEAAQMLAKKELGNKVHLLVRGPVFDRCNEDNQKRINALAKQGLVEIMFSTSVKKIDRDKLVIQKDGADQTVPNDFLFVFAGAEMPHKFLMSLGVQIDKKFGEALGNVV